MHRLGKAHRFLSKHPTSVLSLAFTSLLLYGCGGSGASVAPPPGPSFSIVVNPARPGLSPGGSTTLQVSLKALNGFSNSVSVTIAGLPSGMSAQPASITLSPGTPAQPVLLSAQANVAAGSFSAEFQWTSGSQTGTTSVVVDIGTLQTFSLTTPLNSEIVTRVGGTIQFQIQTTVCCQPGIAGYLLNFTASGLPPNVTATFSPGLIAPGGTTTMAVSAASNAAPIQNSPLTVTATPTASLNPEDLSLFLNVASPLGTSPDNRTDFIRTDGSPSSIVYDTRNQLIYASNLEWNRVDIVSPVTKRIVRSVPVPAPQGLDLSLDGNRVYVSSQTQQMFAIDTTSHMVVQRWFLPASGSPALQASSTQQYGVIQPLVTSNGHLLLFGNQTYTSAAALLLWDPSANTIVPVTLPPTFHVGYLARSADGTKIVVASDVEPAAAVIYDSASNSISATRNFPGFIFGVQANPTGTRFIILDEASGLILYDANLIPLAGVPPGTFDTGVLFSADGSKIYVVADANGTPATFTVDANNLQVIGLAPAYATIPPGDEISPPYVIETPYAVDSSGLIYGSAVRGIALDDSTFFQNLGGPVSTPTFDKLLLPDAGPINAATTVAVETSSFSAVPDVWFGSQRGTNGNLSTGVLQITAPPSSQPGPVNVKILQPDGIQVFDPLAFSYGPAPLFLSGDTGSSQGGATADIIAIGVPTDPSAIQVSVGGADAQVISATSFNPAETAQNAEPFPTVDIQVKLPSGQPGPADVKVSTSAGSATLSNAYHFAASMSDYASPDAFQAIAYDPGRKNVYLAAGDHLDVFSLTANQFSPPIALPSAGGHKQFTGMSLTPDGSKLIVANLTDGSVDIVNPDNPSAAVAVAIAPAFPGSDGLPCVIGPSYVATTSTGKAFVVYGGLTAINCGPGGPVYKLDLTTLSVSGPPLNNCVQSAAFVSSSRDGSKVVFGSANGSGGPWYLYDSASDSCRTSFFFQPYGAAAAGDGNVFATGTRILDPNADLINVLALPDPYYPATMIGGIAAISPLNLEKLNDSGSLLYVPMQSSVDILDIAHGVFRQRITLSEQILQTVDSLAIDPAGANIFVITDHGLTVAALQTAPLSIGSVDPVGGTPGTKVTVRGSGFSQGSAVTLNGQSVASTFVDVDTLTFNIPTMPSGPIQLGIANPDGQSYLLDNAFSIN
jgi:hypothetical protein